MEKNKTEVFNFCMKNNNEKLHCLKDHKGKWVILYFYPKDNTSGCTKEL